jgi:hypothetical protein
MEEKKSGKNAQSLCWLYFIMEKEVGKNIATRSLALRQKKL